MTGDSMYLKQVFRIAKPRFKYIVVLLLITLLCYGIFHNWLFEEHKTLKTLPYISLHERSWAQAKYWPSDNISYFVPKHISPIKNVYYATNWYGKEWPGRWNDEGDMSYQECPYVTSCKVVTDITKANAVVFHGFPGTLPPARELSKLPRTSKQLWIYYTREAPTVHTGLIEYNNLFNWTATERLHSEIVSNYGFYVPIKEADKPQAVRQLETLLTKKSRMSLIINSHCGQLHSHRWEWVNALQEHINVDILGKCGNGERFESRRKLMTRKIRRYKFYLAFENARCKDYITEKFWFNSLQAGSVPVVLGGLSKADYVKVAPPNSFIYAHDFSSAKELANYLKKVARNATLYESFLSWRKSYKLFHHYHAETNFPCLLCRAIHNNELTQKSNSYSHLDKFFLPSIQCNYSKVPRDVQAFSNLVANWRNS